MTREEMKKVHALEQRIQQLEREVSERNHGTGSPGNSLLYWSARVELDRVRKELQSL